MHKFSPSNFQRLENEDRYRLLQPEATLRRFGLREGMTFVDIGAGTGFFSRSAAKVVGESGTFYAAEMSDEMMDYLKRHGVAENMHLVASGEYSIPLQDSLADLTWLSFVLHENAHPVRLLREAERVTKNGGKVVILEWKKQEEEHGPPMEERLGQETLKSKLDRFAVTGEGSLNPSHYYIEIKVRKP